MRSTILALLLCVGTSAGAATVYKWVDAGGVIHYSDQPHPGAQKIEVGSVQTYSGRAARPRDTEGTSRAAESAGPPYEVCELYKPSNDEVFLNTQSITARLRVQPALRPGDTIALALDGRRLPEAVSGDEVTVPVFRGTHSLMLVVEDRLGTMVCQSAPVTFHVRQPSAQAPNPANRPRF
ncbi:MAG TPA: DUF4124 domain-containing protein [Steroidobacteraceae bacterium]|nr:DUF4124 domain-containing protein [Steroidobacteraceae bacterium]